MGQKLRYEIDLTRPPRIVASDGHAVRSITSGDLHGLARLMLDAYVGTIDYDGQDLDDAVEEVRQYFESGHPLLDRSYLVESDGAIVSAVLVSLPDDIPFIGYVMTAPDYKKSWAGSVRDDCLAGCPRSRRLREDRFLHHGGQSAFGSGAHKQRVHEPSLRLRRPRLARPCSCPRHRDAVLGVEVHDGTYHHGAVRMDRAAVECARCRGQNLETQRP